MIWYPRPYGLIVMRSRLPVLMTFLVLVLIAPSVATGGKSHSEQSHFSAEDSGVQRPVAISEDVLAILRQDQAVQSVLENESIRPENIPPSWFSASEVHLTATKRVDLLVVGEPPVSGGNTAMFWVFRARDPGHALVLTIVAHDLILKNTRSKGYRDIEVHSMTAVRLSTAVYRFDGQKYSHYRQSSRDL